MHHGNCRFLLNYSVETSIISVVVAPYGIHTSKVLPWLSERHLNYGMKIKCDGKVVEKSANVQEPDRQTERKGERTREEVNG